MPKNPAHRPLTEDFDDASGGYDDAGRFTPRAQRQRYSPSAGRPSFGASSSYPRMSPAQIQRAPSTHGQPSTLPSMGRQSPLRAYPRGTMQQGQRQQRGGGRGYQGQQGQQGQQGYQSQQQGYPQPQQGEPQPQYGQPDGGYPEPQIVYVPAPEVQYAPAPEVQYAPQPIIYEQPQQVVEYAPYPQVYAQPQPMNPDYYDPAMGNVGWMPAGAAMGGTRSPTAAAIELIQRLGAGRARLAGNGPQGGAIVETHFVDPAALQNALVDIARRFGLVSYMDVGTVGDGKIRVLISVQQASSSAPGVRMTGPNKWRVGDLSASVGAMPNREAAAKRATRLAAHLQHYAVSMRYPVVSIYSARTPQGSEAHGYVFNLPSEHDRIEMLQHARKMVAVLPGIFVGSQARGAGQFAVFFSDDPSGALVASPAPAAASNIDLTTQDIPASSPEMEETSGYPTGMRRVPFDFDRDLDNINNYYNTLPGVEGVGRMPHQNELFQFNRNSGDQGRGMHGTYWDDPHREVAMDAAAFGNVGGFEGAPAALQAAAKQVIDGAAHDGVKHVQSAYQNGYIVLQMHPSENLSLQQAEGVRDAMQQGIGGGVQVDVRLDGPRTIYVYLRAPAHVAAGVGNLPRLNIPFQFSQSAGDQGTALHGTYWDKESRGPVEPLAMGMQPMNIGQIRPGYPKIPFQFNDLMGDQGASLHGSFWQRWNHA